MSNQAVAPARTPWLVRTIGVVGLATVIAPLIALTARVQWAHFWPVLTSPEALGALGLSFLTAAIATGICVLVGVPLAALIARLDPRAAAALRGVVMVPLLMPPLVGGLALLALWGRNGLLGPALDTLFGIQLPFSTPAVVLAQSFVALPFLVISVEQAMRAIDPRLEAVARTLGASVSRAWRRVIVPLALPAVISGATLAFARALAEFGATAMFAGNREGVTRTMPMAIYTAFNGGSVAVEQAYTLSVILVAAAVLVLVALRGWRAGGVR